MQSDRSLWEELVDRYDRGIATVDGMAATWTDLAPYVDAERYRQTADFLAIQKSEARWWRDASIAYWRSLNGLPLPAGHLPPAHDLEYYRSLSFPEAPGQ